MRELASKSKRSFRFSQEHLAFLYDTKTMEEWVGYTLKQRCKAFEMKFPGTKMTLYHLTRLYKEAGIRKKKIRKTKIVDPARKEHIHQEAIKANEELKQVAEQGYRVIFIDEMCVTKSTIPTHEYSMKNKPIEIDIKSFSKLTVAVLAGISAQKGVELVMSFDKSVNTDKFFEFLQRLRFENPFDRIALFMDRLSVHTCRKSRDKMKFHKFIPIYNSPYSPDYNPIEQVFSIVKRDIKK